MPKILEHNLGEHIWDWFDTSTRDMLEGYQWTPETGLISPGDAEMDNAVNEFENLNDSDEEITVEDMSNLVSCSTINFSFDLSDMLPPSDD